MARPRKGTTNTSISNGLKPPTSQQFAVSGWSKGLDQMVDPNSIQDNELAVAINVAYKQYGVVTPRQGQSQLGPNVGSTPIQAQGSYKDTNNTRHLMAVINGALVEYNFTSNTWNTISGKTFKQTGDICLLSTYGAIYILDGQTNLTKWDNSTFTTQTPLSTPTGVGTTTTGTFSGTLTQSYRVSAVSKTGETLASTSVTVANCPNTFSSSVYVTLSWSAVSGADSYNVYRGTPGNETLLCNVTSLSILDQGQYDSKQSLLFTPLQYDTSGGPIASFGTLYHSVMFLNDPNNPSRIVYSGGGDKIDSFSAGDGGGWYDYNKHDGDKITALQAFQDSLYLFKDRSIGAFAFGSGGEPIVQDVNHAIGCVGFKAVCPVEEDVIFFSRYGVYALGNQPQFLNLVRTSELSQIIHDGLIVGLAQNQFAGVAIAYFNHVVLISVPSGATATGNTTTLAYNRLYLNWSEWRGISANNFIQYVTDDNVLHLYAGRNDGKVWEQFQGNSDNGTAIYFNATLKLFDLNMPEHYKTFERLYMTFGNFNAQNLKVTIIRDGTQVVKQFSLNNGNVNAGFGTAQFGTQQYGIGVTNNSTLSNMSVTKYIELFKDYINVQVIFEDQTIGDTFTINRFAIDWQPTDRPLPSSNRLA